MVKSMSFIQVPLFYVLPLTYYKKHISNTEFGTNGTVGLYNLIHFTLNETMKIEKE
jgi:hypothetical protein